MIVMIALFKSFLVELVCFRFYLKSFSLDGHGTKNKKCMGTPTPGFFPLMGTVPSTKYCWAPGSCPSVKILSKSVRHGSLGEHEVSLHYKSLMTLLQADSIHDVFCFLFENSRASILYTEFHVSSCHRERAFLWDIWDLWEKAISCSAPTGERNHLLNPKYQMMSFLT